MERLFQLFTGAFEDFSSFNMCDVHKLRNAGNELQGYVRSFWWSPLLKKFRKLRKPFFNRWTLLKN